MPALMAETKKWLRVLRRLSQLPARASCLGPRTRICTDETWPCPLVCVRGAGCRVIRESRLQSGHGREQSHRDALFDRFVGASQRPGARDPLVLAKYNGVS